MKTIVFYVLSNGQNKYMLFTRRLYYKPNIEELNSSTVATTTVVVAAENVSELISRNGAELTVLGLTYNCNRWTIQYSADSCQPSTVLKN